MRLPSLARCEACPKCILKLRGAYMDGSTHIEIDFLPVGNGDKSGDAICLRYGSLYGQKLMVIDGGDLTAGERLAEHIEEHYGAEAVIEHVVNTHCDGDHANGLRPVLERFKVNNFWVHQPWLYASELNPKFKGAWTDANLAKHLRTESFRTIGELCDIAEDAAGATLRQPFAGQAIGPFLVLTPSKDRYLDDVAEMERTPSQKMLKTESFLEKAFNKVKEAVFDTLEGWSLETLKDPGLNGTSAANETSVILFSEIATNRVLLTGDTGLRGLAEAHTMAQAFGVNIVSPDLVQVPHHGSRHNVSPEALNELLGARVEEASAKRGCALVSAAKGSTQHPKRSVLNAFTRRGYNTVSTGKEGLLNWRQGWPVRAGMSTATPEPLHTLVES